MFAFTAVTCAKLRPPLHGFEVTTLSSNHTAYGAIKVFHCEPGYQVMGSIIRACIFNGKWSGVRTFCQGKYSLRSFLYGQD